MKQLALYTLQSNFPGQLATGQELLENPLQPRRHYRSADFDKNFALLRKYGLAVSVLAPTSKTTMELFYLCADELVALNSRALVAYYLPPLFSTLAARGSGCAADFTQYSRATPAEEISQLYQLQVLSKTKLFRLEKQALLIYMQANNIAYDARTHQFVLRQGGYRRPYAACTELSKYFSDEEVETELYYVDYCAAKRFLNVQISVELLKSIFDDVFAATILNAIVVGGGMAKTYRFSLQDFCAGARDGAFLSYFYHVAESLRQPATAYQMLQFAASAGFVVQIGELYEPQINILIQFAQHEIGAKMLLSRDLNYGRVVSLLLERGVIDEAQLAYELSIPLADAYKAANQLFQEGFLTCSRAGDSFVFAIQAQAFVDNCAAIQAGVLARLMQAQEESQKDLKRGARLVFAIVYVTQSLSVFL